MNGSDVAAKARELIGAPYLHQGRSRNGIDCVGVPIWTMQQLGTLPRELTQANYGRLSNGELIAACRMFCTPLDADELGCLIVIRWPGERQAGHVAVRTQLPDGRPGMLHAYRNHGGVREHGYQAKWPQWTNGLFRLPGVIGG